MLWAWQEPARSSAKDNEFRPQATTWVMSKLLMVAAPPSE